MKPFGEASQAEIEAACRLAGWDPTRAKLRRSPPRRDLLAEIVREVEVTRPTPMIPPALDGVPFLGYAKTRY